MVPRMPLDDEVSIHYEDENIASMREAGDELMKDVVEERKALPSDQTSNPGHDDNDGGSSKNNIPSQRKKKVHFGNEEKGTNDN